jgi:hypothetical protein
MPSSPICAKVRGTLEFDPASAQDLCVNPETIVSRPVEGYFIGEKSVGSM